MSAGPATPSDSPLGLEDVMASPDYLELRTPSLAPGDRAFDFALPVLEGSGTVTLPDFAGDRPVALVFGSYT